MDDEKILYKEESYRIIGSCMAVHRSLGPGFAESLYQEALTKQFKKDGVPYKKEVKIEVYFEGEKLKKYFRADYICYDKIVLELKAHPFIHQNNISQVRSYINSADLKLGIVVNFGEKSLTYKRVINSRNS